MWQSGPIIPQALASLSVTIYWHMWQSGPIIPPGIGFPFCHNILTHVAEWPNYIPRHWLPFPSSLGGGIRTCLLLGASISLSWVELSLFYGWQSVDQFVLVSGSPLWPMTRFYPYPLFSDNCFVALPVGRPLWREDGSVTYSAIVFLFSRHSLSMDPTENTGSHSFSVVCIAAATLTWCLLCRSLIMDVSSDWTALVLRRHATICLLPFITGLWTVFRKLSQNTERDSNMNCLLLVL
jgi:hypothetical protein